MFKKVANRITEQSQSRLHLRDSKVGYSNANIFPEAFSGYPVSGEFYGRNK
ncbi:MAG: hypothetical protein KJO83_04850 [Bacteroidia bacterium]|nr:hypothetical protein [Bacteroidia bacterium]